MSLQYLLDTNVCIGYLTRRSQSVYDRILATPRQTVAICDIVKFELYFGAYKGSRTQENLKQLDLFFGDLVSLPFDAAAAEIAAQVRVSLQRQGTPIGPYDLQIAAIALVHDLTLVTHNLREFERVGGLRCEDWEEG
ncbi:MAG: type II toxin-antitoxin system VapC family toxin [Prochlorothrix sp.]